MPLASAEAVSDQLTVSPSGSLAVNVATGSVLFSGYEGTESSPMISGFSLTLVTVTATIRSVCMEPTEARTVTWYTLSRLLSVGFS